MTRLKRYALIGTAVVVLLLLALSSFLYAPTREALERMEALQFRRMVVGRLGEEDTYRFFFATNRPLEPGDGPLEERFGRQRQSAIQFGSFDTRIEPALGLGMLINPTEWMQNEEIRLDAVRTLEREAFVEKLRTLIAESSRRSLLVVVHGFREAFPSALRKTAFLGHVLDINTPVMVFDWPGNQGSTPIGYRRAQRVAGESGAELAETLAVILREVQPEKLWLLANSMGAQVVVYAFGHLYEMAEFADPQWELEDVVLTAPDAEHARFNEEFKQQIGALTRNLTVYVSSNDRALVMSRIINRAKRLGESTLDVRNPDQLAEAGALAELVEPGSELVTLVDVTPVNRTRNFHNFSLETPEFFDDLYLRLTATDMPVTRLKYAVRGPSGSVYWILSSD